MIPAHMMSQDIEIHYRVEDSVSAYNTPRVSSSVVTIKGYFRPRRSNTYVAGGEVMSSDAMVIVQPSVSITSIESVVVDGIRYQMDGEPMPHWNPLRRSVQYYALYLRRGIG